MNRIPPIRGGITTSMLTSAPVLHGERSLLRYLRRVHVDAPLVFAMESLGCPPTSSSCGFNTSRAVQIGYPDMMFLTGEEWVMGR